jgi:dihydroxyacid dehydratase/phosphogluconate dehydratase
VQLVADDRRPSTFLTAASFHNAIVALAAIGGSTNAVVHLLAIAGRLGIELTIDDFDRIGANVPLLVNLQPAGQYLMDDLFRAGGFLAVLREVRDLLDPTALTVDGRPLVDHLDDAQIWDPDVITRATRPCCRPRASRCCGGRWRRAARSSSRPRHPRTCSSIAVAPWCSTASKTSARASTTRTSTSTPTR